MQIRLNVIAADLSRRHKSDDFNSFLMHLFFEGRCNKRFANNICKVWRAYEEALDSVACVASCGQALTINMLPTNPSGSVRYCV